MVVTFPTKTISNDAKLLLNNKGQLFQLIVKRYGTQIINFYCSDISCISDIDVNFINVNF